MTSRQGIAGAGNWIIDQVKVIDHFPQEDHLAIILSESMGTGGAPYNVLVGLRALDSNIPLEAIGVVGNDRNGDYIIQHLERLNIHTGLMRKDRSAQTSYTDVMSVGSTGRRTFFHNRGANMLLCGEDFEFDRIKSRILHLGYLMLLDALDAPDEANPTRPCAARVLEEAKSEGLLTSLDMVSDLSPRVHSVVEPTLQFVDYLIVNELEAGVLAEVAVRDDGNHLLRNNLAQIAEVLFSCGVQKLVCIHAPEGAFWMERDGQPVFKSSLKVPQQANKGAAGAGDAFCGGLLYGLHEGWDADACLNLAMAHAAQSLSDPTTTGGLKSLSETLALVEQFGYRE